jgi:signal transduction protein with GAF and PtsI domain
MVYNGRTRQGNIRAGETVMSSTSKSRLFQNRLTSSRQAVARTIHQAEQGQIDPAAALTDLQPLQEILDTLIDRQPQDRSNERLARLFTISRLIGSSLEPQDVLEKTMDALIELTGAERGFVVLRDDAGQLVMKIGRNLEQQSVDDLTISKTVVKRVLETGEPLLTTNAQQDERFASAASVMGHNLVNIMVSPLRIGDAIIGALYVDNNSQRMMFFPDDLELLAQFAEQVAIAINNALEVERRERALQNQIAALRIEIDEIKKTAQVAEITDNDDFRAMAEKAKLLREQRKTKTEQ